MSLANLLNPTLPTPDITKAVLKALRGHKNAKYYLREIIESAGVPYETYSRWMVAGAMMEHAPCSETVDFLGTHVVQRQCSRFYKKVQARLDEHSTTPSDGSPYVRMLRGAGPQVFITTKFFGMPLTDYILQYLAGRYYIADACSMVGISPKIFWIWFRRGRLGEERFRDFYVQVRACLMRLHVYKEGDDGQEVKRVRRRPQGSTERRRVRKVRRQRNQPLAYE